MKKMLTLALATLLSLSLAACSSAPGSSPDAPSGSAPASTAVVSNAGYPKAGTVGKFYIGGSVGAGGDMNMRTLIRYLEPEMGITLVPENVTGNRTIYNAVKNCTKDPADGYTFAYLLYPHAVSEIYNPSTKDNCLFIDDYYALCNLVSDSALIAVRADDPRFADVNDLAGLVEYMKTSGETMLISACSVAGDDDIAVHKIMLAIPEIADQLMIINGEAVSDGITSLLNGSLDIFTGNVGDVGTLVADGDMKVLSVFAEERSVFLPDVATAKECGYNIVASTSRGVVIHKDTDPAVIEAIEGYVEKVVNDPAFIEDMKTQGFEVNYLNHEEYENWLEQERELFPQIAASYGW